MKICVQLGEAPIPVDERVRYRTGFKDLVSASYQPENTRVVLVEPNPSLIPKLDEMWADWGQVEIINTHVDFKHIHGSTTFYSSDDASRFPEIFSQDEEYLRRYFPSGKLRETVIANRSLDEFLNKIAGNSPISALSIDLRRSDMLAIKESPWESFRIETLILTSDGVGQANLKQLRKKLKSVGYVRAGRSWGEARTGETLNRPTSIANRFKSEMAQAKVNAGALAVAASQMIPSDQVRKAIKNRMKVKLGHGFSQADVLDSHFGRTLTPVKVEAVERAIVTVKDAAERSLTIRVDEEVSIDEIAKQCFREHGIYPISFSYPKHPQPINREPRSALCSITPGFPYSFDEETVYLNTYGESRLGLTHRKAGWDCFRHLEIMASGAIPLMIDADEIPKYSMIHYPKTALSEVTRNINAQLGFPSIHTQQEFREFFLKNLTSKAMAAYVLRMSGLEDAKRVLFVDEQLPHHADYQSVLSLIGLKQIYDFNCDVLFPVDYLYEDSESDIATLYGRGFGYTKVLPSDLRGILERDPANTHTANSIDLTNYDALVVGSISRNQSLALELVEKFPVERTIWIHGEDSPPTLEEAKQLRNSGTQVFVRSIS